MSVNTQTGSVVFPVQKKGTGGEERLTDVGEIYCHNGAAIGSRE